MLQTVPVGLRYKLVAVLKLEGVSPAFIYGGGPRIVVNVSLLGTG